ncbi:MAG: hypothetical protein QOJ09_290, partial [Actinomycetota bacterium]|nr:hypothetical protein [Actinomycetota bacterium]
MPGEDERPPGDPVLEAARLDAVAGRLETLGAALQRSIGETTESTATLSRTVGTVSADLGRLIGEAVTALGKTRQIVLATDDSVGSVAVAFEQIERRLTSLATELADTVERQRRLADERPDAEALGATVGAEVAAALHGLTEAFTAQLDGLVAELHEERAERAALAEKVLERTEPTDPPLTEDAVRAQVEAVVETVVGPWLAELRDELTQLVTEVHEDRTVLTRRLAGQRDVEELREVVETLAARSDIDELHAVIQEALAAKDDDALERLRTDLLALGDDLATTAKRAAAGQRAVEALTGRVEDDLPAEVERALTATSSEIRRDTEALISEL